MKKIYLILAAASVVLAANSCLKENVPATSREPMIVNFTATAASTKTAFGEIDNENKVVPVLWEGGENLDVCVNEHASAAVQNKIYVDVPEEGTSSPTATWSYDFSKSYDGTALSGYVPKAPYTFYAFYPGNNMRAFHASTDYAHATKIQSLPSVQTPRDNSCDPEAMFLYSISEEYATWPTDVVMPDFQHMTAYGCLTLAGIEGNVRKVTITANDGQYLAGTGWFFYGDNEPKNKKAGEWGDYSFSRLTPSGEAPTETITINTTKSENIWFGCRPTTDLQTLTFAVYTDAGYYEVTKQLTGKNFQKGVVSRMTVGDFVKKETVTYTWTAENDSDCFVLGTSVDQTKSSNTGLVWDASTNTVTQEFYTGYPLLHWDVQMTLKQKKELKYYTYYNEKTSGDVTVYRLVIGDPASQQAKKLTCVDPLKMTIDPTDDWSVKKATVVVGSASSYAHFLDVQVGSELVIEEGPLKVSLDPGLTTYTTDEFNPLSGDVVITVANKDERGTSIDNAIYLYSVSLELVYNPTPQTTPAE